MAKSSQAAPKATSLQVSEADHFGAACLSWALLAFGQRTGSALHPERPGKDQVSAQQSIKTRLHYGQLRSAAHERNSSSLPRSSSQCHHARAPRTHRRLGIYKQRSSSRTAAHSHASSCCHQAQALQGAGVVREALQQVMHMPPSTRVRGAKAALQPQN